MKKIWLPIMILLVVALLISGCAKSTTTSTTTSTSQPATTSAATSTTVKPTTTTSVIPSSTTVAPATTTTAVTTTAAAAKLGGTLTILNALSPSKNVGWPVETNMQNIWYIQLYAEPLVYFTSTAGIEPCLAESWKIDSSAATPSITFTLRKGIKFQDGSDFTADAVKYQASAVIENKNTNAVLWKSIDILDPYNVRFNLTKFTNSFWVDIYNPDMYIVAPGPVREKGIEWAREHPIGTGPFNMVKYDKDAGASFTKNTNYWQKGKPYLDKIECVVVKDIMAQEIAMQSGTGQVMLLQDGKVMSDMKKAGFTIYQKPGGSSIIVPDSVNPTSIFKDIRIRQAIDYAIDKKTVADATGFGYMFPTGQLPPLGNPARDETIPQTSFDQAKAKELMTAAGYPNGFKTKLITWSYDQDYCLVVQQQLAKVGIQAEMDVQDNLKFLDAWMNGWKDACLVLSASSGPNFAASIKQQFPPYGIFYKSMATPEGFKAKIDACLATADPVEQTKLNKELTRMLYDDKSLIVYMTGGLGCVVDSKVQGADWLFGADMYYSFRPADTYINK
jgi:peptide/nickel transport system substrate-binding protein